MTALYVDDIVLIHLGGVIALAVIPCKTISAFFTSNGDSKSTRQNRGPSLSPKEIGSLQMSGSTAEEVLERNRLNIWE